MDIQLGIASGVIHPMKEKYTVNTRVNGSPKWVQAGVNLLQFVAIFKYSILCNKSFSYPQLAAAELVEAKAASLPEPPMPSTCDPWSPLRQRLVY